ncbi:hypothetical protein HN873_044761, partial [Arachis hypogaea]
NLDGLSEQAILNLLCSITMAATAYKTKRATDREAAVMIIQGFTGQLKRWWDNFLTIPERELILSSIKPEDQSQDATATLIFTIIKNFLGNPNIFKDRNRNPTNELMMPYNV